MTPRFPVSIAVAAGLLLAGTVAASVINGWHAAGVDGLDGRPLAQLRACGAGGEAAREAFTSFDPGTDAAAERELTAGRCDVSLSGAGSNMAERMATNYPGRTIYRIDGAVLRKVADGQSEPPWLLLGKQGAAVPSLANARLCGNGAWRNQYRRKVASANNVYGIDDRLGNVEFGSCDLAVFNREELAELGARANGYARYVLDGDAIKPWP